MTSVALAAERIYVGMDVSRDTIAVAVLRPGEDVPAVELISHDGEMVRRLIGKFADRSVLAAWPETSPTWRAATSHPRQRDCGGWR